MIFYKTTSFGEPVISAIEVDKHSKHTVTISGCRQNKRSDYVNFFETETQAKQYLIDRANAAIDIATTKLKDALNYKADVVKFIEGE